MIFSKEIEVDDFIIKVPTINDIVKIGEEKYKELLIPYIISKDMVKCDEKIYNELKDFDLFFILGEYKENITLLDLLLESLKFYFKEDVFLLNGKDLKYNNIVDLGYDDDILENIYFILVENNGLISRENFDYIADTILKINNTKKSKIEPEPKFENDRQKDIYNKIMEGRRRKAEREYDTFNDIIHVVQFGGKSFISYDEILKFTVCQLIDAFTTILCIDSFNINFGQYQAGADPKQLDLEHWINKIKQINKQ